MRLEISFPSWVPGLFWWRREELLALPLKMWLPGLGIFLAGVALHFFGYLIQEPHISIVALFVGIYGLMGLAWGPAWLRKSFFPFFLFVFCIPLGTHADIITTRLRIVPASWLEPSRIRSWESGSSGWGRNRSDPSGAYQYEVAPACSGIPSLFAILLLGTVYGFVTFRALWKRLLFMALAFPFAVSGNLARMLLIVLAAEIGGQGNRESRP